MGKTNSPVIKGQAAGKSGRDLGIRNEEALLNCIKTQGWIRDYEAALLTGMSHYTVGIVSRRLVKNGSIFRAKNQGSSGFFFRLTAEGAMRVEGKSGKDISIPVCWRHDALAIHTLDYLAKELKCGFETEAGMRRHIRSGKFPDGKLVKDDEQFYFEQELSRKSGPNLRKQVETIVQLATRGSICHVAYPYPSTVCSGIDHETRHTNAIRHKWGSQDARNIKLVRCCFDSSLAFQNMRPSHFEIIDLPGMVDTPASRKPQRGITDQAKGFQWKTQETRDLSDPTQPLNIEATLRHNGVVKFQGTFIQAFNIDDPHLLVVDGYVSMESFDEDQTIHDFMYEQMKIIERDVDVQ